MLKSYVVNGSQLERYFEMDENQLERVRAGEIENIEIVVDHENRTACYTEVSDEELRGNVRNGVYVQDNYEGVIDFLKQEEGEI